MVEPSAQVAVAVPFSAGPVSAVMAGEALGPPTGVNVVFGNAAVLVFVTVNVPDVF